MPKFEDFELDLQKSEISRARGAFSEGTMTKCYCPTGGYTDCFCDEDFIK